MSQNNHVLDIAILWFIRNEYLVIRWLKYISHLYLVLAHSSWFTTPRTPGISCGESWGGWVVFCYVKEMNFGKHWWEWEPIASVNYLVINVESFSPTPDLQGGERSWRMSQSLVTSDLLNYKFVRKPPLKAKSILVHEHLEMEQAWSAFPQTLPLLHLALPQLYLFTI